MIKTRFAFGSSGSFDARSAPKSTEQPLFEDNSGATVKYLYAPRHMKSHSCKPAQLQRCLQLFFRSMAFFAQWRIWRKLFYRINILVETGAQEKPRRHSKQISIQTINLLPEACLKKSCQPIFGNLASFSKGIPIVNTAILLKKSLETSLWK